MQSAKTAGDEVQKKREIEKLTEDFEKDLNKQQKKIENLDKQIADQTLQNKLSEKEMNALREQLQESLKNNEVF